MLIKSWELCVIAESCDEHFKAVPVMGDFAIYLFFWLYWVSSASLLNLYIKRIIASNTDFFFLVNEGGISQASIKKSFITVDVLPSTESELLAEPITEFYRWIKKSACRNLTSKVEVY